MNVKSDVYCPDGFADTYDEHGNLIQGAWRQMENSTSQDAGIGRQQTGRPSAEAVGIRTHLATYFSSPIGELGWQRTQACIDLKRQSFSDVCHNFIT